MKFRHLKIPRFPIFLSLFLVLAGCGSASLREDAEPNTPGYALPPAEQGILSELAGEIRQEHGAEYSGFRVLDSSFDGLYWRLALMDSATTSLDIMSYLWYPDFAGKLIMERAILAAERGVKVRIIVDDVILQGQDETLVNLQEIPNVQLRLFNPWKNRGSVIERLGEAIAELERLNTRMHDKLVIADGHAAIVGGRNIGDHYFGLGEKYNFHDTDLLGIGEIALQSNAMFDSFWNSEWVVSASALNSEPDPEVSRQKRQAMQQAIIEAPELQSFPIEPRDWTDQLRAYAATLRPGRSKIVFDEASADHISQEMAAQMFNFFSMAKEQLLIQNAYVIPSENAVNWLQELSEKDIDVRLLTNSLASHDVPAVNSHYEPWRDDFIRAGVELWEFRANPAIQKTVVDVPPIAAEFTGLHSKCAVVDSRYVFIGSMNLDPRSRNINTEMGAFVDSPELAADMIALLERNMSGENAWRVQLDEEGNLFWENSDERVDKQPARQGSQRIMNVLMKLGPADQY